jgi:hypothetical protein
VKLEIVTNILEEYCFHLQGRVSEKSGCDVPAVSHFH